MTPHSTCCTVTALQLCGADGLGELRLDLPAGPVPAGLAWLPGQEIIAVAATTGGFTLRTRAGMELQVECRLGEGELVLRGTLHGLPAHPPRPVPADSALSRDYQAGGLPLLRMILPLPVADAHQRPRWSGQGCLVELLTLDARTACIRDSAADTIVVQVFPPQSANPDLLLAFAFALVIGPEPDFLDRCHRLLDREGVAGPHSPQARARVAQVAPIPTIFALKTGYHNARPLLAWARQAGARSILLHAPTWAATDGHYAPNLTNWPGGWPMLRELVEEARAAGITVGLHTLTTSIADTDPYVTPIPDPRLLTVWSSALTAGIDAGDTTLPLADPPEALSERDDYFSFGRTVRVGDELVRYRRRNAVGRSLLECERGAYGTRAARHREGDPVHYLFRCYDEFALDPQSSLADEVAAALAEAFHAIGAEMIYFDDSEAMPEPYQAHVSAFQEKVWRAIGLPHLHVQASSTGAYGVHLLARVGQQDTVIYKRAMLDHVILAAAPAYQAAGLVPDFGWFSLVCGNLDRETTTLADLDCLMARTLGCGAGVTIFAAPEQTGIPLFAKAATRLARWAAAATSLSPETRAELATPDREFRVVHGPGGVLPDGAAEAVIRETRPWRARLTADAKGRAEACLTHDGQVQPLGLLLGVRPPLAAAEDPGNLRLWPAGGPGFRVAGGAATEVRVEQDQALLCWQHIPGVESWARWRLVFPEPLDLSRHRALDLRLRWEGTPAAASVTLVQGLNGWTQGQEFALPTMPGTTHQVVDPVTDPEARFRLQWPDNWYSFFVGLNYHQVEAIDLIAAGLEGTGQLVLEHLMARRELTLPGEWLVSVAAGARTITPPLNIPWNGSLELRPGADGVCAEILEMSGALSWQWTYPAEQSPLLVPGENLIRLSGLAPGSRLTLQVDRLV